jgi:hypothetical protein
MKACEVWPARAIFSIPLALRCSSSPVPTKESNAVAPDDHVAFAGLRGFVEVGRRFHSRHLVLDAELEAGMDVTEVVEAVIVQSVRNVDRLQTGLSRAFEQSPEIGSQTMLLQHRTNHPSEFAVLGQEVV